ncbi:MAG: hypothetical protein IKX79_06205 [Desulfovibrionaceae bacterium]|nr:hypothetical protein [Desulfovibrionaceae bacterium]
MGTILVFGRAAERTDCLRGMVRKKRLQGMYGSFAENTRHETCFIHIQKQFY